ncbi:MAG TPA: septum formation initiator family protein [Candidatus Saccharimonadales bacterium]|nr:septum formation initiator family protein [Candidatus Saccharimonadales bacterium]
MELKIKTEKLVSDFFSKLNDIRFVGQLLFVLIVLMVSWSGVKSIQTNYGLQKQITALNQQNGLQKLTDANLKLQNQYYESNQYLELSARQNFGLAAPGEKEVIVPQQVALAHTVNLPSFSTDKVVYTSKTSTLQRNMESWVNFFLHRTSN